MTEPPTSVLFLDIDGVLNRTAGASQINIEPALVHRLKHILKESGAKVVLSTFWHHFDEYIAYILHRHGIDGGLVIGSTPGRVGSISDAPSARLSRSAFDDDEYSGRAVEIRTWLDAHPSVTRFVILDDRASAADEATQAFFVHTDAAVGLTDADVEKALRILSSCEWSKG